MEFEVVDNVVGCSLVFVGSLVKSVLEETTGGKTLVELVVTISISVEVDCESWYHFGCHCL